MRPLRGPTPGVASVGIALAALVAAVALSSCAYNSVFLEEARLEFNLPEGHALVGKVLELRFASTEGGSVSGGFPRSFHLVAGANNCVWKMAEYGAYEESPLEGSRVALSYRFREPVPEDQVSSDDYLDTGARSLEFFLPGKGNDLRDSEPKPCTLEAPGGAIDATFSARYYFGMVY